MGIFDWLGTLLGKKKEEDLTQEEKKLLWDRRMIDFLQEKGKRGQLTEEEAQRLKTLLVELKNDERLVQHQQALKQNLQEQRTAQGREAAAQFEEQARRIVDTAFIEVDDTHWRSFSSNADKLRDNLDLVRGHLRQIAKLDPNSPNEKERENFPVVVQDRFQAIAQRRETIVQQFHKVHEHIKIYRDKHFIPIAQALVEKHNEAIATYQRFPNLPRIEKEAREILEILNKLRQLILDLNDFEDELKHVPELIQELDVEEKFVYQIAQDMVKRSKEEYSKNRYHTEKSRQKELLNRCDKTIGIIDTLVKDRLTSIKKHLNQCRGYCKQFRVTMEKERKAA